MKSWLLKFRISSALDGRKPLPPALEQAVAKSGDARHFAEISGALDRALKYQLPRPQAPEPDHASIMRAVRVAAQATRVAQQPVKPRWIPVVSFASVILLGVILATQWHPIPIKGVRIVISHPLPAAGSALELGAGIVRDAPAAAMSPLADEIQRLDRDLASTRQFLLASLP